MQRLTQLRVEADNAVTRAEDAEGKNKKYEQDILSKDQEITSLTHKVSVLEADIEKMESKLRESKESAQDAEANKTTNDALTRKVTLLEEELDTAEKNLKEVTEKCVFIALQSRSYLITHRVSLSCVGCVRLMSRPNTSRDTSREWNRSVINGKPSTRCVLVD